MTLQQNDQKAITNNLCLIHNPTSKKVTSKPALIHRCYRTSLNWCWLAGNFFGCRFMNQTKIICDNEYSSENLAYQRVLLLRFFNVVAVS